MAANDWKKRLGVVYSTNPDFDFQDNQTSEAETLPKQNQRLRVKIERAGRKGKTVTLVTGFVGTDDDLKQLAKDLKTKLSTGGSAKDGEIVIQGDVKARAIDLLQQMGYRDSK